MEFFDRNTGPGNDSERRQRVQRRGDGSEPCLGPTKRP